MDQRDVGGRLIYLPSDPGPVLAESFLDDVLIGWRRAQATPNFRAGTADRRIKLIHRMIDFVGSPPWQWSPHDADEFFAHLRGVRNLSHATIRAYQSDVRLFLDYATNPLYEWNENCGRLFGTVFSQVITDFNRATHVQTNDAQDKRRPFTRTELQQFFDLADLEPERILNSGRKGALAAWRDAVAFKVLYGWGLRAGEGRQLQLVDCSRNVRAPGFGEWGLLRIRHGKAMRGSPAKQRTVLTVFDWAAEALESVLLKHPAVAEAAVVPAPDATRLAVPKAYVALAAGWEPNEDTAFQILKYAREHIAPYLRIRRLEFFELPKTVSGKIRRVELRAREDSGELLTGEWRDDQFSNLK